VIDLDKGVGRVELVPLSGISSVYDSKSKPGEKLDISCFNNVGQRGNYVCEDMGNALKKLDESVRDEGGNFYIIDLFRSWEVQEKNRQDYTSGKKKAFVAKPGESFHNAGRAVDIAVKELNFPNIDKEEWLECFWELAIPLGFRPIIKFPDLGVSECWHFDFPGNDWDFAYKGVKYSEAAKCATIDVGQDNETLSLSDRKNRFIQAQLIRRGHYYIGNVDGVIGPKTQGALDHLLLKDKSVEEIIEKLSER